MKHCEICSTPFPDATYLDMFGVCGCEVCREKAIRKDAEQIAENLDMKNDYELIKKILMEYRLVKTFTF